MEYIEDFIRDKIIREINKLELPPEWKPDDVIKYITRMIDRNRNA